MITSQVNSVHSTLVSFMPFSPPRVPRWSQEPLEIHLCCSCSDWARTTACQLQRILHPRKASSLGKHIHDVLLLDKRQTHPEVPELTRIRPGISTMDVVYHWRTNCFLFVNKFVKSAWLLETTTFLPLESLLLFPPAVNFCAGSSTAAAGPPDCCPAVLEGVPGRTSLQYRHVLFWMSSVTDLNCNALRNWTQRGEYQP